MQNQHSRHFLSFFHVRAPALTVGQAVAQAKAEAEAEAKAAAAILKENSNATDVFISGSNATDVFISGFKGVNFKINRLYSPTQETRRDGRMLYLKSGESGPEAMCIEQYEGQWQVKMKWAGAAVYAAPLFKETAHCIITFCMDGTLSTTETLCINPALR